MTNKEALLARKGRCLTMTNKEALLAKFQEDDDFLAHTIASGDCDHCPAYSYCNRKFPASKSGIYCRREVIEPWLKDEAIEEEWRF